MSKPDSAKAQVLAPEIELAVQEALLQEGPWRHSLRDLARKVQEITREQDAKVAQEYDNHICFTEPSPQCKSEKPSGCVIAAAIRAGGSND